MISKTAIIYPNVKIGKNAVIEDYCIIGAPLKDGTQSETIIGDNCYIRSHTVIYCGNKIGDNFQTGNKANIRENNKIGNNVSIGCMSVVEHHTTLEDNVRMHTACVIGEYSVLKKGAWLGPHVVFTNVRVPLEKDAKSKIDPPMIEENAIVGGNVTLSPGVVIQKGALVGSGSNVTKNIEANTVAFGHPAKSVRPR